MLLFVVLGVAVLPPARAGASVPIDSSGSGSSSTQPAAPPTTVDGSFLEERNLSECLNNSNPLPGCGREPVDPGDRGGAFQLATFGILGLAIAFISWRVVRAVRARDRALETEVPK